MNLTNIITGICSLLLLSVGADKFLHFIDPPCSLMPTITPTIWKILGILQIAGGVLIWFAQSKKMVAVFFLVFMIFFSIYHIINNTTDIGGALFMAVLFGLLVWNPMFIRGKKKAS